MSYRALNWAWEADLPTSQKFVLVALADMADERETCFPGQERIARMVGGSVSTVARAVKALEERGALVREQRRGPDGMRTSDRYRLQVHRSICRVDESPVTESGSPVIDEASPVNEAGVTRHSDGVTPSNPQKEPPVGTTRGRATRATRIPEPFMVTAEMKQWAAEEVPSVDAAAATRAFVDYWRSKPGKDATKLDWIATWRNWLRREAGGSRRPRPSAVARGLSLVERMDQRDADGEQRAVSA